MFAAIPVPQVSLVAAPVAESVAVPAAAPVAVPAAAPVAVPGVVVGAPIAPSPSGPVALEHVGQITSQYHAQDELGQYAYGYSGGPSAKHELKTADGLTSGVGHVNVVMPTSRRKLFGRFSIPVSPFKAKEWKSWIALGTVSTHYNGLANTFLFRQYCIIELQNFCITKHQEILGCIDESFTKPSVQIVVEQHGSRE
ncbi:unnamed protein product [Nesidiocoris tenuis]|uniref:Uncharacterized protein n=1 Tax=Nesidiocoris tenuis TaxID=355587 RepID=A0A6H5G604_9HEMI|nr:unnamed protein product [Nesidiocoris tenuis]